MPSTDGAKLNLMWSKRIKKSGIPLFCSVGEGMYRKEDIEEFVWGHNKILRALHENLSMLWSYNSYNMAIDAFPETKSTFRVSGAVSFDKYTLFKIKKNQQYSKNKKIIGYAAFDFNSLIQNKEFVKTHGEDVIKRFINEGKKCETILKKLAINFPDVLFLVKPHPRDGKKTPFEVKNLQSFNNIKIDFDLTIHEAINLSDIWLNYNSSSNIEAWLMNKPSITFLKEEKYFSSKGILGSVRENDVEKIKIMIEEFYCIGAIKRFTDINDFRHNITKELIGYTDGMNHIRFISFLKPYIEKVEQGKLKKGAWKLSNKEKFEGFLKDILYKVTKGKSWIPFFRRYSTYYQNFSLTDFDNKKLSLYKQMDLFYHENSTKIDDLYNNHSRKFDNLD